MMNKRGNDLSPFVPLINGTLTSQGAIARSAGNGCTGLQQNKLTGDHTVAEVHVWFWLDLAYKASLGYLHSRQVIASCGVHILTYYIGPLKI